LIIGYISNIQQAAEFKPFTTDIFKGFLAIFLLEMGITTAGRFSAFRKQGSFIVLFSIIVPAINGCIVAFLSQFLIQDIGNRFIFSVLAASASYIAVPAAMRLIAPKADPGLYIPMALGVTFPFNLTIGIPLYYFIITSTA
jgi:hypothetical protein